VITGSDAHVLHSNLSRLEIYSRKGREGKSRRDEKRRDKKSKEEN